MTLCNKFLILCAFVFFQESWGMPATTTSGSTNTVSYGTQAQNDFNKNLATILSNVNNGATIMAAPPFKFGIDTVPGLIQYSVNTAADKASKIVDASKDSYGKVSVGLGHAIGGGGVLGSSVAGGAMQVVGHGLGAGGSVVEAGAKAGVDMLGNLGDRAASGINVGGIIGGETLTTLGNGMMAAGAGANVFSNAMATLLDAIGFRLSMGISKAEQIVAGLLNAGVLKLENGALSISSNAQRNFYTILNSFFQILVNVQKLFDNMKVNIGGIATTPATANTGTVLGTTTTPNPSVTSGISAISSSKVTTKPAASVNAASSAATVSAPKL